MTPKRKKPDGAVTRPAPAKAAKPASPAATAKTPAPAKAADKKPSDRRFIATIALKLLLISTLTAALLAGVNALTAGKIAENARLDQVNAIHAIFPDTDESTPVAITAENVGEVYLVFSDGDLLGYAASVSPNGFGGAMAMIVGVNSDGTLAGIEIVSHSETPGLGSRVTEPDFLSQFTGHSGKLSFGDGIDAITGSTISSKTVLDGVNAALGLYSTIFSENDAIGNGGSK